MTGYQEPIYVMEMHGLAQHSQNHGGCVVLPLLLQKW